jgi:hypothetical protein
MMATDRERRIEAAIRQIQGAGTGQNPATLAVCVENLVPELLRRDPAIKGTMTTAEFIPLVREVAKRMGLYIGNTWVNEYTISPERARQVADEFAGTRQVPEPSSRLSLDRHFDDNTERRRQQVVAELLYNGRLTSTPPQPAIDARGVAMSILTEATSGVSEARSRAVANEFCGNAGIALSTDVEGHGRWPLLLEGGVIDDDGRDSEGELKALTQALEDAIAASKGAERTRLLALVGDVAKAIDAGKVKEAAMAIRQALGRDNGKAA